MIRYCHGRRPSKAGIGKAGAFDDDGIIELTGLIVFQNLSSKFNSALDVPSQGFCRRPGAPPTLGQRR